MDPIFVPTKQQVMHALLLKGSVFVHVNGKADGVVVPQYLTGQSQIVLQIGLNMPVPILDLSYDGDKISGVLSFKGVKHFVSVPYTAVFALVGENNMGVQYLDCAPKEVLDLVAAEQKKAEEPASNVVHVDFAARRKKKLS